MGLNLKLKPSVSSLSSEDRVEVTKVCTKSKKKIEYNNIELVIQEKEKERDNENENDSDNDFTIKDNSAMELITSLKQLFESEAKTKKQQGSGKDLANDNENLMLDENLNEKLSVKNDENEEEDTIKAETSIKKGFKEQEEPELEEMGTNSVALNMLLNLTEHNLFPHYITLKESIQSTSEINNLVAKVFN
eukprot:CAMPEP_0116898732 /NCGR_PEP_ID=MMETSP0467-20121206/7412_1 /TAXON_ID=283647 /ORGANISM="Mesodinium pulex, Strain SPMC105" /LENGTH=190 /DNA_ID=CAMNT_0004571069 /DNA_START=915 /DNA_END=1484 /DNA_ORIENTATION=+